jgi:hypothetical protein
MAYVDKLVDTQDAVMHDFNGALVPAGVFVQDLQKPPINILDPDNPEPPPNDQNSAPPRDVLMSKKKMIGASPS